MDRLPFITSKESPVYLAPAPQHHHYLFNKDPPSDLLPLGNLLLWLLPVIHL